MKLEVGMYVRYKTLSNRIKITKIIEIDKKVLDLDNKDCTTEKYIIGEPSHNLIDLIEVGDYVNELPVEDYYTRYDEEKDDYIKIGIITLEDYWKGTFTSVEDIKSIVTKEQLKDLEYKVESEVK